MWGQCTYSNYQHQIPILRYLNVSFNLFCLLHQPMVFYDRTHTLIKFKYKDVDANVIKKIALPVPVRGNRDILTSLQTGLTFRAKVLRYAGLCNLKCQICLHRLGSESNFCPVWCCSPILNIFITSFVSWCLRYSQNLRLFFFKFLRTKVPIISAFAAKNRDLVGKPPTAGRYISGFVIRQLMCKRASLKTQLNNV